MKLCTEPLNLSSQFLQFTKKSELLQASYSWMGGHKSTCPPIKLTVMLAQIPQMQHCLSALTPRFSTKRLVLELLLRGKIIPASILCIPKMRGDLGHCRKLKLRAQLHARIYTEDTNLIWILFCVRLWNHIVILTSQHFLEGRDTDHVKLTEFGICSCNFWILFISSSAILIFCIAPCVNLNVLQSQ